MPIYIRFENNRQVETTTLKNKPEGWQEAPKNFDWQKRYCLTEGGEVVQRSEKDIEDELLQNAKSAALSSLSRYFNSHTYKYAGYSHQKAKSYDFQAKAAEKILADQDENDSALIEPLAKVRGISVIEMARLIQEKATKATRVIIKCEELEDTAKSRIKQAKTQEELRNFLNSFEQEIQNSLESL